jgi:uncharacterized protein (TIGR04222 family)
VNIFDLRGPEFLAFYTGLLAVGIVVALVVRRQLRGPSSKLDVATLRLQPLEVAVLAEGDQHALKTALAGLAQRELVAVDSSSRKIWATGKATGVAQAEERIHVLMGAAGKTFEQIASDASHVLEPARRRLQSLGLLVSDEERWKLRLTPVIVLGFVLAIGMYKINVGKERGRPVGNLTVLCWVTAAATAFLFFKTPERSRRGDAALQTLRSRNMGLRQTVEAKPSRVAPDDLSLAVALYGATILQTGPLAALRQALRPPPNQSSGSSSCSSGGGCGGGCGGGGCGGCGS